MKIKIKPDIDYELAEELRRAKEQMDTAYLKFQDAVDPDLIDSYIYEGQAAWKRYRFLMKQAKLT